MQATLNRPNTVVADPEVPQNLAEVTGEGQLSVDIQTEQKMLLVEIRDLLLQIVMRMG